LFLKNRIILHVNNDPTLFLFNDRNTPIETVRVLMQRDVSMGKQAKSMGSYWNAVVEEDGYPGLFRGVTPRGIQAIWQTVFMVVVPNMLGM
jgi:hypothetical protein